eukprot:3549680-Ditylum_brightwellii.AAC.1
MAMYQPSINTRLKHLHRITGTREIVDAFLKVLHVYKNSALWYYGVKVDSSNSCSLSLALGLKDSSKVLMVLEMAGMAGKHGSSIQFYSSISK